MAPPDLPKAIVSQTHCVPQSLVPNPLTNDKRGDCDAVREGGAVRLPSASDWGDILINAAYSCAGAGNAAASSALKKNRSQLHLVGAARRAARKWRSLIRFLTSLRPILPQ